MDGINEALEWKEKGLPTTYHNDRAESGSLSRETLINNPQKEEEP